MERVAVGLLGLGTVGSGVARLLDEQGDRIARRAGRRIDLKWALVRDPAKPREVPRGTRIVTDAREIIDDPEVAIVVETMGGTEPALAIVLDALAAGKDVVTANKALLAEHGPRGLRAGPEVRPGGGVRGERGGRDPDRPGAGRRAGGQPGPEPGGDRQRHLQLHPHRR